VVRSPQTRIANALRGDRLVASVIVLGMIACCVTAVALRPQPLPLAAQRRWAEVAAAQEAGQHLNGRTFVVDGVTVDGESRPFTQPVVAGPRASVLGVHGWAFDPSTLQAAGGLAYRVDAGPWRDAGYHIPRPDVALFFGLPNAVASGFDARVSTTGWRSGRHEVELATVSANGVRAPLSMRIAVAIRAR
jgi:hypothetical protein